MQFVYIGDGNASQERTPNAQSTAHVSEPTAERQAATVSSGGMPGLCCERFSARRWSCQAVKPSNAAERPGGQTRGLAVPVPNEADKVRSQASRGERQPVLPAAATAYGQIYGAASRPLSLALAMGWHGRPRCQPLGARRAKARVQKQLLGK
jgi:hypothetical protein